VVPGQGVHGREAADLPAVAAAAALAVEGVEDRSPAREEAGALPVPEPVRARVAMEQVVAELLRLFQLNPRPQTEPVKERQVAQDPARAPAMERERRQPHLQRHHRPEHALDHPTAGRHRQATRRDAVAVAHRMVHVKAQREDPPGRTDDVRERTVPGARQLAERREQVALARILAA